MFAARLVTTSAPTARRLRGRRRRNRPDAFGLFEPTIAAAFAVSTKELHAPNRGTAPVAFARQCAMYLAHVGFGLSLTETGRRFGRDRTTAAHACRVIEERRDDPFTDRQLSVLEAVCRSLRRSLAEAEGARS